MVLEPIPRKDRSCLLPLPDRPAYTVCLSLEAVGVFGSPAESGRRDDGELGPRDSREPLLPIVQIPKQGERRLTGH